MNTPARIAARTFKNAFCECYGCPDERFQEELFWKCLSPLDRALARLVHAIWPDYFFSDMDYLRLIGEAPNATRFWRLCNEIRYDMSLNDRWLRRNLHLRISGLRLIRVYEEIVSRKGPPFPEDPPRRAGILPA